MLFTKLTNNLCITEVELNARKIFLSHKFTLGALCFTLRFFSVSYYQWRSGATVGRRTCYREIASSAPGRALLCKNFGQVVFTIVPMSFSSLIWHYGLDKLRKTKMGFFVD